MPIAWIAAGGSPAVCCTAVRKEHSKVIEIDLKIQHHFSDGVYAKQMALPKGHFAVSHKHKYSHLSILASGIADVEVDGITTQYIAPACINIAADAEHKITALEDVVWYCIHATEETDVDQIDQVLIKEN